MALADQWVRGYRGGIERLRATGMKKSKLTRWAKFKRNMSRRMASGMLVLVPVGVTLLAMKWLFAWGVGLLKPKPPRADEETPETSA
jgi:hypothetical protein